MEQVANLLKKAGVFHMASVDGESARVRPFGFVMVFDGRLYFTTGNKKPVYRQLRENPSTEMCAMLSEDRWIRVSGRAVFDGSMAAKRRAFDEFPRFKGLYQSPENPDFEVFYLDAPSAVVYSMTEPPEKIL
jgi:uncharacterized pyridoxamine 5'-phosphate oxidase family protein